MQKRGQVTLFIIIGILVVSLVVLGYYFRAELFQSEWEQGFADSLAIPSQAEEVHESISACVEELTIEAVDILGMQGGQIDLPDDPIPSTVYNPFSNSLEIFEGSGMKTTYWFYEASNAVQYSQIPLKEEMEVELGVYVDENLARCASNFSLYEEYNISAGDVYTEVEILNDEVLFTVDYPVKVAVDEFVFEFPYFYESVDVPLGEMYEAAVTIQMKENEDFYLEDMAYDVMFLQEGVPMSETNFDCDKEEWDVEEVQEELKQGLANNIPYIKIGGLDYSISDEVMQNYYEWDVLGSGFKEYSANLLYFTSWPFEMGVYPNEDGVMTSNSGGDSGMIGAVLRSLFCLKDYKFIYDVKFPVLITLSDDDTGYVFQFATMVIINNNQARTNEIVYEDFGEVESDAICDEAVTLMTVYASGVESDGGLIDLVDADVSFECINYVCDMGITSGRIGDASLYAMFPVCSNGFVVVNKEGYVEGREMVSTFEESTVTVILEQEVNLSYDIKVVDGDGNTRSLKSDETAYIGLTEQSTGYSTSVFYPDDGTGVLEIIPGTYDVQGVMMQEGGFDINVPAQTLQSCTSNPVSGLTGIFGMGESCVDVDMSDYELDSVLSGSVELVWEPNRADLYDATHVTFYIAAPMEVDSAEDVEEAYALYEASLGMVEPELR